MYVFTLMYPGPFLAKLRPFYIIVMNVSAFDDYFQTNLPIRPL